MVQTRPQLKADVRELVGRKVKHLRKEGWLPASVYGHDFKSVSVQLNQRDTEKLYGEVGESGLVDLMVGEEKLPILFKNPQYHPLSGELIHLDLHKVNLKEKIVATVPIELTGEAPATKFGNLLIEISKEIEVEALPTDLPEKVVVDVSGLAEVGATITVADVKVDGKVTIKTDPTQVIVKIEEPKEEVIEETPAEEVAPGDVPATEQKAPEESEGGAAEEKKEEK